MSDTKTGAAGKARNNETIGGGFFVFRRHRKSGRIHPSQWPFEHASAQAAADQARKLADANPGHEFIVVGLLLGVKTAEQNAVNNSPSPELPPGWDEAKFQKARAAILALRDPRSLAFADGYYAKSLVDEYGMSVSELEKITGNPEWKLSWK